MDEGSPVRPAREMKGSEPAATSTGSGSPAQSGPAASLFRVLVAGAAGSVLAWIVMQAVEGRFFHPSAGLAGEAAGGPSPELQAKLDALMYIVTLEDSALMMGLSGAILGVCLGLAETASRGISVGRVGVLLVALLIGLLCGAAGGAVAVWMSRGQLLQNWDGTYRAMLINAVNFGLIGLAAGLSAGLPTFRGGTIVRMAVGGLGGGILAGACFPFVAALLAILSHLGDAEGALPTGQWLRLIWLGLGGLLMAWMIHSSAAQSRAATPQPTSN